MRPPRTRGFALLELGIVLAIAGTLLALLLILGADSRRQARLGEDFAKLRQIAGWTTAYAADNQDLVWSFSWKKGIAYAPGFPPATSDLDAIGKQAIEILHRVAGRTDIVVPAAWFSGTMYSHLVVSDYNGARLPDLTFVSAADRYRLKWARDDKGYEQGIYPPSPWNNTNEAKRWPYSSSFQLPPAFYDRSIDTGSAVAARLSQASTHSTWVAPSTCNLGNRALPDVAFPSEKVLIHDAHARHAGKAQLFFAIPAARVLSSMVDGSAAIRAAHDCNKGWNPQQPTLSSPITFSYAPSSLGWEPNNSMGTQVAEQVPGGYQRFTRGFLEGRDFDGPETCTGQPGCP